MTGRGDSKPERLWSGDYGKEWTEDNEIGVDALDSKFQEHFGISRLSLLNRFLGDLDRDARILEVGTNIGTQLLCLKRLGFTKLYGIDLLREAIDRAHRERPELDIIEGNLFDIPFKDQYFDLVFTSGVLIHVPEEKLDIAMDEIVRCTRNLVYGHEYYAEEYTEIVHRGHEGVLWKANFPHLFQDGRDLELVDIEYLHYRDNENVDVEYLLKRS